MPTSSLKLSFADKMPKKSARAARGKSRDDNCCQ